MTLSEGRLVYDSARAGRRTGERSGSTAERAMLFRSGDVVVDVVLHSGGESLRLIQGQVVDARRSVPIVAARVRLGEDAESVETDAYGQFALSTLAPEGATLLWISDADRRVVCTLPAPVPAA